MAATPLQLFPKHVSIGDANGVPVFASHAFLLALQKVFERLGGATGASVGDLSQADDEDSGLEEFKAELLKAMDAIASEPYAVQEQFTDPLHPIPQEHLQEADPMHPLYQEHAQVEQLTAEVGELREMVARLARQIQDQSEGTML